MPLTTATAKSSPHTLPKRHLNDILLSIKIAGLYLLRIYVPTLAEGCFNAQKAVRYIRPSMVVLITRW